MREAVRDVGAQRRTDAVDDLAGTRRTDDDERRRRERRHPSRGDDVVEIGEVVAVQVREQRRGQLVRADTRGRRAHEDTAPAVEQEAMIADLHEGRRSGPHRIGNRAAGAQENNLDRRVGHRGSMARADRRLT